MVYLLYSVYLFLSVDMSVCLFLKVLNPNVTHDSSVMAGKNRFSVADRFEYLQGLVTEFQDTDSEGTSVFADTLLNICTVPCKYIHTPSLFYVADLC